MDDLRAHPTVKPVAMIADAMKDCTRRNEIVLDTFCGSGTTLLAAERVGRRGYGLEIDARICRCGRPAMAGVLWHGTPYISGSALTFEEIGLRRCDKKKVCRTTAVDKRGRR